MNACPVGDRTWHALSGTEHGYSFTVKPEFYYGAPALAAAGYLEHISIFFCRFVKKLRGNWGNFTTEKAILHSDMKREKNE